MNEPVGFTVCCIQQLWGALRSMKQFCQVEACVWCAPMKNTSRESLPATLILQSTVTTHTHIQYSHVNVCTVLADKVYGVNMHTQTHTHTHQLHSCNQRTVIFSPVAAAAGLNHLATSNKFHYWHACGVCLVKRVFASGDFVGLYIAEGRGQWSENAPNGDNFWEGVVRSLNSDSRSGVLKVKLKGMKHSLWNCRACDWLTFDHTWAPHPGMFIWLENVICHRVRIYLPQCLVISVLLS